MKPLADLPGFRPYVILISRLDGIGAADRSWRKYFVRLSIIMKGQADLLEVVPALVPSILLPRCTNRRQQQKYHHAQDNNYDQQVFLGKSVTRLMAVNMNAPIHRSPRKWLVMPALYLSQLHGAFHAPYLPESSVPAGSSRFSLRNETSAPMSGLRYFPSSLAGTVTLTRIGMAALPRSAVGI